MIGTQQRRRFSRQRVRVLDYTFLITGEKGIRVLMYHRCVSEYAKVNLCIDLTV